MKKETILEISNLKKYFLISKNVYKKAVDDVSFKVSKGEIFGIIGESGCGKTTLVRTIKELYKKDDGKIFYKSKDVESLSKGEKYSYNIGLQMIFQDPVSSLDPRMNILDIVTEGLLIKGVSDKDLLVKEAEKYLKIVGISKESIYRYPYEFSGGQKQRIGLARALIMQPEILILDEPISSLDVSMQAQILNLLKKLQKQMNLTMIFISHNLLIANQFCDQIAVMNNGKFVECGTSKEVFNNPLHPYTKKLINSISYADPNKERNKKKFDCLDEYSCDGELTQVSGIHYVRKEN